MGLISFVHSLFKMYLCLQSSSSPLPVTNNKVENNNGSHNKYQTTVGKIIFNLCFTSSIALLIFSYTQLADQPQLSLPFQLVYVFIMFGFSTSLGAILFSSSYPITAKVFETMGTLFGVLAFFLAMGIAVDRYFKNLQWVTWLTGAIALVFIFVKSMHQAISSSPEFD